MTLLEKIHEVFSKQAKSYSEAYQFISINESDAPYQYLLNEQEKLVFTIDTEDQGQVFFTTARIIWENSPIFKATNLSKTIAFISTRPLDNQDWKPLTKNSLKLSDITFISPRIDENGNRLNFKRAGIVIPLLICTKEGEFAQIMMESGAPIVNLWNILLKFRHTIPYWKEFALRTYAHQVLKHHTTSILFLNLSWNEQMELFKSALKDVSFDEAGKIICYWKIDQQYAILTSKGLVLVKANKAFHFVEREAIHDHINPIDLFIGNEAIKQEILTITQQVIDLSKDEKHLLQFELDS